MSTSPIDPILIAIIILAAVVIVLIIALTRMHLKLKRFLVGSNSSNIGDSLAEISKQLESHNGFRNGMESYLKEVESRLKRSITSVNTVRFNPFKGVGGGGNQSFATTFLNEEGDGVIISSLYSREHVSIFAKPVKSKESQHELSEEEKRSLNEAVSNLMRQIK